jgi:hypothetical protein
MPLISKRETENEQQNINYEAYLLFINNSVTLLL